MGAEKNSNFSLFLNDCDPKRDLNRCRDIFQEVGMKDQDIISLYFDRDERAIIETDKKYGKLCMDISMNVLKSKPDAEECVNDTYLKTWNHRYLPASSVCIGFQPQIQHF